MGSGYKMEVIETGGGYQPGEIILMNGFIFKHYHHNHSTANNNPHNTHERASAKKLNSSFDEGLCHFKVKKSF